MNNTVYVRISDNSDGVLERIRASVDEIVASIQQYVPGYEMRVPPMLDGDKVTVVIRVRGAGDFLPEYSGNLDIMNAAAVRAAELISERMGDNAHE
jgi:acetaldehyde dehydrogenase